MKKLTLPILISFSFLICSASVKINKHFEKTGKKIKTVTIVPISGYITTTAKSTTFCENAFMRAGFNIIERSNLDLLLKEQALSLTGILKDGDYYKLGKIENLDAIVLISGSSDESFKMKIVHIETGIIVGSYSMYYREADRVLVEKLAKKLM